MVVKMKTKSLVVLVALVVVGYFGYQAIVKKSSPASTLKSIQSKLNPAKTVGVIMGVKTSKSLDPKTGMAGTEVNTFSTKDPVIYVVLQVNKPAKGTKFEYTRYFNGKYVDRKSLETTKDGMNYVSFSWRLKNAQSKRLAGDYKVRLYTNGNFEREVSYQVR